MTRPLTLGLLPVGTLSPFLFQWEATDLSLLARNGDTATYARAGVNYGFDTNGTLLTFTNTAPVFEFANSDVVCTVGVAPSLAVASGNFRDLTNAAWTKTSTTALKNQVGIDGIANSASQLTATATNGTCTCSAGTSGTNNVVMSAYLKRITGSGNIQMTQDGGTTWTTVGPITTSWARYAIPFQSRAAPTTIGFRVATSGDVIAVDWAQVDLGQSMAHTSQATGTATDTGLDFTFPNLTLVPSSFYVSFYEINACHALAGTYDVFSLGSSTSAACVEIQTLGNATGYLAKANSNATAAVSGVPVLGNTVELILYFDGTNVNLTQSINGGATTTVAVACPLFTVNVAHLCLGGLGNGSGNPCPASFQSLRYGLGNISITTFRAAQ